MFVGCVQEGDNEPTGSHHRMLEISRNDDGTNNENSSWSTIYRSVRLKDNDNLILQEHLTGSIDVNVWERVARPHLYMGDDEPFIYTEHAWSSVNDDGSVEEGYEIKRALNEFPLMTAQSRADEQTIISEQVFADLTDATRPYLRLIAKVRDVPYIPVPLMPPAFTLAVDDYIEINNRIEDARQSRISALEAASETFRTDLFSLQGQIVRYFPSGGWIVFDIPRENAAAILQHSDIQQIESDYDPSATDTDSLGSWRANDRVGVAEYWADGHLGQTANPNRHAYGRLIAGVSETRYFEDGSPCYLLDSGNNCSSGTHRIEAKYDCSGSSCTEVVGNFSSAQRATGIDHGTLVLSIIAADYTDGQGDGKELGDPAYNPITETHSTQWENNATGFAPEVSTIFMGGSEQCTSCYAASYEQSYLDMVDVFNMSHVFGDSCVGVQSTGVREDELAEAFDQGVFLVGSARNQASTTTCTTNLPGTVPRVFTVNGLDSADATCQSDYTTCEISGGSSARGGADFDHPWYLLQEEAISIMDVAAPAHLTHLTAEDSATETGRVTDDTESRQGTSYATPMVAGSALAVKDYLLDDGQLWVNSPGRLHAVMLSMADRWMDSSNTRATTGTDVRSGMGRFKLRPIKTGLTEILRRWSIQTISLSPASGNHTYMVWSTPNQSNISHLKCTMMEGEDHRGHSDLADVYLTVRIREPVNGACSSDGELVSVRSDDSFDLKHFVAFTEPILAGNCVEVTVHRMYVPVGQTQLTSTFCYGATADDNEPS